MSYYFDTDTASDAVTRSASVEELLTPLRDCILDKPYYISGTCTLPTSCFSLFYKIIKDGHDARFGDPCAAQESERPDGFLIIDESTLRTQLSMS
jgi:hypothetical protein